MGVFRLTPALVVLFLSVGCGDPDASRPSLNAAKSESESLALWSLDFTSLPPDVRPALEAMGLFFEQYMDDDDEIFLSAAYGRLNLLAREPTLGLLVTKPLSVGGVEWIEIDWGIDQYPEGADWFAGKNREAAAIYVFFGDKVPSGSWFLPDIPRYVAVFLGRNAPQQVQMVGNSYKESGRYVCLGSPPPSLATTSRFNVGEAYRAAFGVTTVPPVTSVAIEVDTRGLRPGTSSAFVSRITLERAAR